MNCLFDNKTKEKRNYRSKKIFIIKKMRKIKFWLPDEDKMLLDLTANFGAKNWLEISKRFNNKSPVQCSARYLKIKPGIKKGHWSPQEDTLIAEYVNKYGFKWSHISKIMSNRNGKQIRDRYLNYLDQTIKREKFSVEEDNKLKELYIKYGSKWTKISMLIERRTPEMIKNRFYSFLKSRIHIYEKNYSYRKRLRLVNKRKILLKYRSMKNNNSFESNDNLIKIQNIINVNYTNINEFKTFSIVCSVISFSILGEDTTNLPRFSWERNNSTLLGITAEVIERLIENPLYVNKLANYYVQNYGMIF